MKLLKWLGLLSLFGLNSLEATPFWIKNENRARIPICIKDFPLSEEQISIRLEGPEPLRMNFFKDSFLEGGNCVSVVLPSGEYDAKVSAPEDQEVRFESSTIDADANFYVKDGEAYSSKSLVFWLGPAFVEVEGSIYGDWTIKKLARKMILTKEDYGRCPKGVWGVPTEIDIREGKIKTVLDKEGRYCARKLLLEAPDGSLERADVEFEPQLIEVKKGHNYLTFGITPKVRKAKIELKTLGLARTNIYLIQKPWGNESLEELLYVPTDDFLFPEFEVPLGEYLAELIDNGKVHRKKIVVGPFEGKAKLDFNGADLTDFSVVYGGEVSPIIRKKYELDWARGADYDEKVPVFIGNEKHEIRFKAWRNHEYISTSFYVDGKEVEVLSANLDVRTVDSKDLCRILEKNFEGAAGWNEKGGHSYSLKNAYVIKPFTIEFQADLKFRWDGNKFTGLTLNGEENVFYYKVYQHTKPIKIKELF